jgi:soluble lytic murein transglycosylase-like protein
VVDHHVTERLGGELRLPVSFDQHPLRAVLSFAMSDAWKLDPAAATYLPELAAAETACNIPTDLLARVAYQECSWRPDVINYQVDSGAGAVGIMQLEPRYFPTCGISWQLDIMIGAHELQRLYAHYGDWQLAVAAYNWGEGDVDKWDHQFASLPTETQNYVTEVFADVPVPGSILSGLGT